MSKPNDDGPDYKAQVNSRTVIAEDVQEEAQEVTIQDDENLPRIPPVRTYATEEGPAVDDQEVQSRTVIAEGALASNRVSLPEAEDEAAGLLISELPSFLRIVFGPDFDVEQEERKPVATTNVEEPPVGPAALPLPPHVATQQTLQEASAVEEVANHLRLAADDEEEDPPPPVATQQSRQEISPVEEVANHLRQAADEEDQLNHVPQSLAEARLIEETVLLEATVLAIGPIPKRAEDTRSCLEVPRRKPWIAIAFFVFLISGAAVGAVCGSGTCGGRAAASNPTQVPSMAPSVSMLPTTLPTVSPRRPFVVFETTEQLYQAVDTYILFPNSQRHLQSYTSATLH